MLPEVRSISTRSERFTFAQHEEWYARQLAESLFLIAEAPMRVGYVRWRGVEGSNECEVSIAISPTARRHGHGRSALLTSESLCRQRFGADVKLVALVLAGNVPSQRLFTDARYLAVRSEWRMGKQHTRFEKSARSSPPLRI